ncbi:hypothetical protein [Kribbella jiaozuonensis]|uniref:Uncharacterized protein n=1 Tax=Kribbella jiaozuonensis TaxID=2575441 RepID=A0A4U3LMP8_9ACTN|nr:hypothetical protein [Kribbella jiaozuonensis]TKK75527.1 hypothetical protein FDA38_34610 [Kribbella jiaozuonensis]
MTEDLKTRFEQLVADPPPPSAVPSEAVFARVRTVRRRRTAGVITVAAAGAVAITLALGNVTNIGGAPPITNTPGAPKSVITGPPTAAPKPPPPIKVALKPTIKGRTVTMTVALSGKAFVPTAIPEGTLLSEDSFMNLSGGTDYSFGEGMPGGSDGGAIDCTRKKLTVGSETYVIPETHVYTKPGTYKFTYTIRYCGTKGWFPTTATTQLVVR